jgi:hypothetical protein
MTNARHVTTLNPRRTGNPLRFGSLLCSFHPVPRSPRSVVSPCGVRSRGGNVGPHRFTVTNSCRVYRVPMHPVPGSGAPRRRVRCVPATGDMSTPTVGRSGRSHRYPGGGGSAVPANRTGIGHGMSTPPETVATQRFHARQNAVSGTVRHGRPETVATQRFATTPFRPNPCPPRTGGGVNFGISHRRGVCFVRGGGQICHVLVRVLRILVRMQ